jgi:hypothetical protein
VRPSLHALSPWGLALLGTPTTGQRPWSVFSGLRFNEELGDVGRERLGDPVQKSDGRVLQLPFEAAHVGPIDTGIGGELLLR